MHPLHDYFDIIYDEACNVSFHQQLEMGQYHAPLAMTPVTRGIYRKIYSLHILDETYLASIL